MSTMPCSQISEVDMIDDDAFDGFGALTCQECGNSLDLRWRRTKVTFDCLECGTSATVARRGPRRSWFRRATAHVEGTTTATSTLVA